MWNCGKRHESWRDPLKKTLCEKRRVFYIIFCLCLCPSSSIHGISLFRRYIENRGIHRVYTTIHLRNGYVRTYIQSIHKIFSLASLPLPCLALVLALWFLFLFQLRFSLVLLFLFSLSKLRITAAACVFPSLVQESHTVFFSLLIFY